MNIPETLPAPLNVSVRFEVPRVTWLNATPLINQLQGEVNLRQLRGETTAIKKDTEELIFTTLDSGALDALERPRLHAAQTGDFQATGAYRQIDTRPVSSEAKTVFSQNRRRYWAIQFSQGGPLRLPNETNKSGSGVVDLGIKRAQVGEWLPSVLLDAALLSSEQGEAGLRLAWSLGELLARLELKDALYQKQEVNFIHRVQSHTQLLMLAQLSGEALPHLCLDTALRALAFEQGHRSVAPLPESAGTPWIANWEGYSVPYLGPLPGSLHLLELLASRQRQAFKEAPHPRDRLRALIHDHDLFTLSRQAPPQTDTESGKQIRDWSRAVTSDPDRPGWSRLAPLWLRATAEPGDLPLSRTEVSECRSDPFGERTNDGSISQVLSTHGLQIRKGTHDPIWRELLSPWTTAGMMDVSAVIAQTPGLYPDSWIGSEEKTRILIARAPTQLQACLP